MNIKLIIFSNFLFVDCSLMYKENFAAPARSKLPIFWNWVPKNVPDQQKCVGFQNSKKVLNYSTLLYVLRYLPYMYNCTLSQNNRNCRIQIQACDGWRRCLGFGVVSGPDIWILYNESNKKDILYIRYTATIIIGSDVMQNYSAEKVVF